jgi:hypothetical protein
MEQKSLLGSGKASGSAAGGVGAGVNTTFVFAREVEHSARQDKEA